MQIWTSFLDGKTTSNSLKVYLSTFHEYMSYMGREILMKLIKQIKQTIELYYFPSWHARKYSLMKFNLSDLFHLLSDLKNQTIVSSCVTHILPSCGYFKGQEQICFNPTSWHLVTYNFLRGHKF